MKGIHHDMKLIEVEYQHVFKSAEILLQPLTLKDDSGQI